MTDGRGSARCVTTACATAWNRRVRRRVRRAVAAAVRRRRSRLEDARRGVARQDAVIGGSDAGAHLDMMCGAIYTTSLLGHGAREHQVVTLEEALRWEPPISTVVRAARRRCGLGGIAIPAGTSVSVSVAAANRDPEQKPEPDRSTRRGRTSRI